MKRKEFFQLLCQILNAMEDDQILVYYDIDEEEYTVPTETSNFCFGFQKNKKYTLNKFVYNCKNVEFETEVVLSTFEMCEKYTFKNNFEEKFTKIDVLSIIEGKESEYTWLPYLKELLDEYFNESTNEYEISNDEFPVIITEISSYMRTGKPTTKKHTRKRKNNIINFNKIKNQKD